MRTLIDGIRQSLVSKLILTVGIVFLMSLSAWAYVNVSSQKQKLMENIVAGIRKLYDLRNSGAVVSRAQKNVLDHYRRRQLTGRLAGVFDEL